MSRCVELHDMPRSKNKNIFSPQSLHFRQTATRRRSFLFISRRTHKVLHYKNKRCSFCAPFFWRWNCGRAVFRTDVISRRCAV